MKFTPPTKAKDEQYDVHPPLNQKAPTPPPAEHKEALGSCGASRTAAEVGACAASEELISRA